MAITRIANRQRLDRRLEGLDDLIGPPPAQGWVRTIRDALVMSGWELGLRLGVSASRVAQIEIAERGRSLRLDSLDRVATAMNCRLYYVLVPKEPLEAMVRGQAERRALENLRSPVTLSRNGSVTPEDEAICTEEIEQLADVLAEHYGLWGLPRPSANP
jgi:predicted DNA-binding mobile mystery protein A